MTALVFLVSLLAWALLALGLPRHHSDWFGSAASVPRRRLLRALGWLGLPAGLALSLVTHGAELGSVLWAVALMLAALAWSLLMSSRARQPTGRPAHRGGPDRDGVR